MEPAVVALRHDPDGDVPLRLTRVLGRAARGGVEPPTFRVSVGRSYQVRYLAGRVAGAPLAVDGGLAAWVARESLRPEVLGSGVDREIALARLLSPGGRFEVVRPSARGTGCLT